MRVTRRAIVRSLAIFVARDSRKTYEGCSCELAKKAQIVLCKETKIGDVEHNHGKPIHAETERVAGPLFRIVSIIAASFVDLFEDCRMHDTRTSDFNPLLAAFDGFRFHINLEARFGERKEVRPKFHFASG